jgi:hypothetical protein
MPGESLLNAGAHHRAPRTSRDSPPESAHAASSLLSYVAQRVAQRPPLRRALAAALLVTVAVGLAWQWLAAPSAIARGPGVVAPRAPLQLLLDRDGPVFEKDGFRIAAVASFELEARVIRSKAYCCTGPDRVAPNDVVFGWGRMSDESVLQRIDFHQSGRLYSWRHEDASPIPHREIEVSSANMHLIPATDAVESRLARLRPGNIVTLRGYLVMVTRYDGFVWRSSLTREDTGSGASELVWVEALEVR